MTELGLSSSQEEQLRSFVRLLLKWNKRINLISAKSEKSIVSRHIEDSLALVPIIGKAEDPLDIVDVGTGGGLPSIVLAIARPKWKVWGLEPIHKKHAFHKSARRELALDNFTPQCGRLENMDRKDFDVAVSRAVWDLNLWLEKGLQVVKKGGLVCGMDGAEEHALLPGAIRFPTKTTDGRTRSIVTLRNT